MPEIKIITFDLDNTLWDVERVMINAERHLQSWLKDEIPEVLEHYSGESLRNLRTTVVAEKPELVHDLSKLRTEIIFEPYANADMVRTKPELLQMLRLPNSTRLVMR